MPIKVLVVDDHEMVRLGIAQMLKGSGINVVAEAKDGHEAFEKTLKLKPDVVLLDAKMPERDGFTALERIRRKMPHQHVIIMSAYDSRVHVARAVSNGADDYLTKDLPRDEIIKRIQSVFNDEDLSEKSPMRDIKRIMVRRKEAGDEKVPLTPRETQVLRHISLGLSNREIGLGLEISVETVKEHVQNILRKLDVNDRTQAAVWAVKQGLV